MAEIPPAPQQPTLLPLPPTTSISLTPSQTSKVNQLVSISQTSFNACCQALSNNAWDENQALSMLFDLDADTIQQLAATWQQSSQTAAPPHLPIAIIENTTSLNSIDNLPIATIDSDEEGMIGGTIISNITLLPPPIVPVFKTPKPGDPVRIRLSIDRPSNGWGNVQRGEVGRVLMIDSNTIVVDFPSEKGAPWLGNSNDVEVVTTTPTQNSTTNNTNNNTDNTNPREGETKETKQTTPSSPTSPTSTSSPTASSIKITHDLIPATDNRIPQAGDTIRRKKDALLAPNNLGEVLVIEQNSRITAIFVLDNGAPRIVMAGHVDVMLPKNTTTTNTTTGNHTDVDTSFLQDMQSIMGGSTSSPSSPSSSSVFAHNGIDPSSLDNVDPATRQMLMAIMEEDERHQIERRKLALQASNAEIANSTDFGFQSNLMNLTKKGPKIRLRKKIQMPREWTIKGTSNQLDKKHLEIENLFACALFDKKDMKFGLKNVNVTDTTVSNDGVLINTANVQADIRLQMTGETKSIAPSFQLNFKSGDMLCVHPPLSGGPWWRVENVKIEEILSRNETEMLTACSSTTNTTAQTTSATETDISPRINRNFVQPLVCFYRLRLPNNSEFSKVSAIFLSSMGKLMNKTQVTAIDRIQNQDMWEDYHVRHERVDQETMGAPDVRIMNYGCPNLTMVLAIATQGFDWRIHAANGGISNSHLGQGFYFDETSEQAHSPWKSPTLTIAHLKDKVDKKGKYHMILARVCVGRSVKGDKTVRRPPPGFHSTKGDGKVVVFDFCQAYPLYHIEYTC